MTQWPRVSILLLNYNRWQDTLECLESVFRLDYPDFQVIVCDNGSPNGSFKRLKSWAEGTVVSTPAGSEPLRGLSSPPVRKPIDYVELDRLTAQRGGSVPPVDAPLVLIQTGENLGFAGGNNVGLRYLIARGATEYVWLLNNDTVVAPDALRRLVEVATRDERLAAVGARVLHYSRPESVWAAGGGRLTRWNGTVQLATDDSLVCTPSSSASGLDYVAGTSMLIPLSALARIGLFDEQYFMYSEETDWCLRARKTGLRLAYASAARVWHKEAQTIGRGSALQDYFFVRNTFLFMRKFFAPYLPLAMAYGLYRYLLPKLFRGEWRRFAAVARAYADFVRHTMTGRRDAPITVEQAPINRWAEGTAS